MTSPSLATCYHEAAHGVATLAAGMRLKRVSVRGFDDTAGLSVPGHSVGDWDPAQLLVVTLAGPLAEARHTGRPLELSGSDARNVSALVGLLAREGDTEADVLRRFTILAESKVTQWWDAIRTTAHALQHAGELSGDAVERLTAATIYSAEGWTA